MRVSKGQFCAALGTAMLLASLASAPAFAAESKSAPALLPGAGSHDPISIDAGKLDYFDKEQKLVYSGGVVAAQGESTLKGSQLTIFLVKDATAASGAKPAQGETAAAASASTAPDAAGTPGAGSSVRRMEVKGPVTVISKDQVATGDNGSYDKTENKVTLVGNVTLSQGSNVTKGEKLVYDLTSGQAQVFGGRVSSLFVPGSAGPKDPVAAPAGGKAPKHKPAGPTASR